MSAITKYLERVKNLRLRITYTCKTEKGTIDMDNESSKKKKNRNRP